MPDMNETPGRSSEHEPKPASTESVWCEWKNAQVNINDAQIYYTDHNVLCIECQACQRRIS
jgi:7-cyano-7-deazaguanine synthase in queuosine biosynthesis